MKSPAMLLDTCFLIDLQREFRANRTGDAQSFLQEHSETRFLISVISATEFLEGFENPADGDPFLRPFTWLEIDSGICREASRIRRDLRMGGMPIGDFDILIAATAKIADLPLVTNDSEHFARIPDLRLTRYNRASS